MEYSGKHRVSLSTLRRRIKAGSVKYQFNDGKYFLEDKPLTSGSEVVAPPIMTQPQIQKLKETDSEPSTVDATVEMLLQEIKKAYTLILHEKEEQILQLRDELADLKTLVRVLEESHHSQKEIVNAASSDFDLDLGLELDV